MDALARALDESIAAAAEDYYCDLPRQVTLPEHWTHAMDDARQDLDELRGGRSPDYSDELVALLYAIRYQLSHSNMAAAMVRDALRSLKRRQLITPGSKTLQIVDLGSGSGAMLIGTTLVAAESVLHRGDVERVIVTGVEPSAPLRRLANLMWDSFRQTVHDVNRPDFSVLELLRLATDQIEHEAIGLQAMDSILPVPDATCWVSALHIFYDDDGQQREVQGSIDLLVRALQPRAMFMTAHPMVRPRYSACVPQGWRRRPQSPEPLFGGSFNADHINGVAVELDFLRYDSRNVPQAYALWNPPATMMDIVCLTPSQGRLGR